MRDALSAALAARAAQADLVFLTGDLGFQALEPLQAALGERFLNAGVAEQNMISVAAGLARSGFRPWAYSIAPFIYARPFEQVRNDICMHKLPVTLVGNGGGYAYGVMGSTHHALEDYGALLTLTGMRAFVPAFRADLDRIVEVIGAIDAPVYLRLGRCELPDKREAPPYAAWRRLCAGGGPVVAVVGPLAGLLLAPFEALPAQDRPSFWIISELPIEASSLPDAFLDDLSRSIGLIVAEEHTRNGGAGQMLAHALMERGETPARFLHRRAEGYPSGLYGSQSFHRRESGLDPESLLRDVRALAAAKAGHAHPVE